ncbi:MAG: DUF1638 domain-containing protein [Candidatus Puniceispirillaceae bacterium]
MARHTGLTIIGCGALAKELLNLIAQFPDGQVELTCLPASWHNTPEKIVPALRRKIQKLKQDDRTVLVAYGDCGTGGDIDALLATEQVERIAGPHCYEMYMGQSHFDKEMEAELGTFFVTDYMVRHFERIVMKGMGLRAHPQLRDMYFQHYTRFLYLAQIEDEALRKKAEKCAKELDLRFEYQFTGYGEFQHFVAKAANRAS